MSGEASHARYQSRVPGDPARRSARNLGNGRSSVEATEDRVIPPAAQRNMAARAKAVITEVAGSHTVYISQPKAVAEANDAAARAVGQ